MTPTELTELCSGFTKVARRLRKAMSIPCVSDPQKRKTGRIEETGRSFTSLRTFPARQVFRRQLRRRNACENWGRTASLPHGATIVSSIHKEPHRPRYYVPILIPVQNLSRRAPNQELKCDHVITRFIKMCKPLGPT